MNDTAPIVGIQLGLQTIPLSLIKHRDWMKSEMRVRINAKKVSQYAEKKRARAKFPPPVVFIDTDERYWIGDGFHRLQADIANGAESAECDVRKGSLNDAIEWNVAANKDGQGLLFGVGDIKKAVVAIIRMAKWENRPYTEIADFVGCSGTTVSKVARSLGMSIKNIGSRTARRDITVQMVEEASANGESQRTVADALGCSVNTVRNRLDGKEPSKAEMVLCPHCNGTGRVPIGPEANGEH